MKFRMIKGDNGYPERLYSIGVGDDGCHEEITARQLSERVGCKLSTARSRLTKALTREQIFAPLNTDKNHRKLLRQAEQMGTRKNYKHMSDDPMYRLSLSWR